MCGLLCHFCFVKLLQIEYLCLASKREMKKSRTNARFAAAAAGGEFPPPKAAKVFWLRRRGVEDDEDVVLSS